MDLLHQNAAFFSVCVCYIGCVTVNTAAARNLYLALCVFGRAELLESGMWNFMWR